MTCAALLRSLLAAEALFYALLAAWLLEGGQAPAIVGLAIAVLALSGRGLFIGSTYAIAHQFRSPIPPAARLGSVAIVAMMWAEYLCFVLLFSIVQPWQRRFMGDDRLVPCERPPVLLVHGYQCNRGVWLWQRRRLESAGWTVATLNLEPVFASIDAYGEQIHRRIEEICAATGAARIVVVGHSMGGLAARAYLRAHGTARVAKLITLGTPHSGSRLARLGLGPNARQMEPGSAWLEALNAAGGPLPETVAAWSRYDNYVMPQQGCLLPGARNVALGAIGHLTMLRSPAVTRLLLDELSATA